MTPGQEKDYILSNLQQFGGLDLDNNGLTRDSTGDLAAYYTKHEAELLYLSYVEKVQGRTPPQPRTGLYITNKGITFINNGGYTALEVKGRQEASQQKADRWWKQSFEGSSLLVAIAAFCVAALTYWNTPDGGEIDKLKGQINTLKSRIDTLESKSAHMAPIVKPNSTTSTTVAE